MKLSKDQKGIAIALACAVVVGFYPASSRAVYADGGNVIFMVVAATWARAILPGTFCLFARKPLFATREDRKQALIGGCLQALTSFGVFGGFRFLPGPLVMIIFYTHSLMLLFFMAWRREVVLDAATLIATILALLGLTFVLDIWHIQEGSLIGIALSLMAAVATVSRQYVYGKQTQTRDPAVVVTENFIVASIVTSCAMLIVPPRYPTTLQGYEFAALGTVTLALGTMGMFYGLSLLGAFRWSLWLKLEPVFTALFSYVLLGEVLKPTQYGGMVIVLGSLVAYQISAHHRSRRALREP